MVIIDFVVKKNLTTKSIMIGSRKQTIEDIIVETLARNPYITGPDLVSFIKVKRPQTTKQAVYAALSPLLRNEIVHKRKQEYFLTNTWMRYIYELLKPEVTSNDEIFILEDGQSISYHFPNLLSCDKYWAHIFSLLIKKAYEPKGVMLWYPHYIFLVGRNKVEQEIIDDHAQYKNTGYYSFGGATPIDQTIKKKYTSDYLRINTGADFGFKNNYFLNVFGDIVVEVFLTMELSEKIENWYQSNPTIVRDNVAEFRKFFEEAYPIRMKISRNKKKAQQLRKKLSRDFYIPSSK